MRNVVRVLALIAMGLASGCGKPAAEEKIADRRAEPPALLSSYKLFAGELRELRPASGVIPYDLNTPLFSDYTDKYRFIKLPAGTNVQFQAEDVFQFPVGTIIAKTFAYPVDARDPSLGRRLIETRLLIHESDGWVGLPYVWNDEQTEARLELAGGAVDVSWVHRDGNKRTNNYIVPNANQCKGCHKIGEMMQPIGPTARQLNRDFAYENGRDNQLKHWANEGLLANLSNAPKLAVWDEPKSGTVEERARAWLEINCAHCHRPDGPARNSGLDLRFSQNQPVALGVMKSPVAAGPGTGGRSFDIVPGKPDESILMFRIASTHPGIMMPELGKRLVHDEGVALVRSWIESMPHELK